MKASRPPVIATWLLDRFGASPQIETIAGDLLEQYQQGRSRLWYWREVITAILMGAWSEFRQHSLLMLRAVAMGWLLIFLWGRAVAPIEISFLVQYFSDAPLGPLQLSLLTLLIEGPLAVAAGWIVARFSRPSRIPSVIAFWVSALLFGAVNVWRNHEMYFWSQVWLGLPLVSILVLLGGGLLTGSPKRWMPTQRDAARDRTD
jgi:peptidoglycan/LPS O-acetylase OafA/YrhL